MYNFQVTVNIVHDLSTLKCCDTLKVIARASSVIDEFEEKYYFLTQIGGGTEMGTLSDMIPF